MASLLSYKVVITLAMVFVSSSSAQLDHNFYLTTCPNIFGIVENAVKKEIDNEKRMGASLLRLHFHDCFVNGCDASILLDGNEKDARPNKNSARGFEAVDRIKTAVEIECHGVVSCADILAIAAMKSVAILGGYGWNTKLGRRDSKTASKAAAESGAIPSPTSNLSQLIDLFSKNNLTKQDLVVLSGGHTIGNTRCTVFRNRIYNESDINKSFAENAKQGCPVSSGDDNLEPLDLSTPEHFDTNYFQLLMEKQTLLHSDQQLFSGGSTDSIVKKYSNDPETFYKDFGNSMIKMGDIKPLTGTKGQIRKTCRRAN
ncbi:peroxidase 52 [Phtheirospermum japonicum]|uniref:Peroxidase n=1 Tax=Phtheirospermum japonicum TaxID=374723 RepID=A0A830DAY8_9LAMI|nr:peroxidase 52 [Phtheirospermum japonicum]